MILIRDNGLEGVEHEVEYIDIGSFDEYYAELYIVRDGVSRIVGSADKKRWRVKDDLVPFEVWLGPDDFFRRLPDQVNAHVRAIRGVSPMYFRLIQDMWDMAPPDVMLPLYKAWRTLHRRNADSTVFARANFLLERAKHALLEASDAKSQVKLVKLGEDCPGCGGVKRVRKEGPGGKIIWGSCDECQKSGAVEDDDDDDEASGM